ncbi:MAG: hypothetical protein ACK55Z_15390, partial [bacterium]
SLLFTHDLPDHQLVFERELVPEIRHCVRVQDARPALNTDVRRNFRNPKFQNCPKMIDVNETFSLARNTNAHAGRFASFRIPQPAGNPRRYLPS